MKSLLEPEKYKTWEETIAWANLYPVSYACGGNPNSRLEKAQRTASGQLLCHDLQDWRPRAALFITEVNRKSGIRDLSCSRPFHDTKAFFLVRPDARHLTRASFAEWISDVVKAVRERGFGPA